MGELIDIDHTALAPYWCTHTHNVTAARWMLIFCECYCPPRQSCFSLNINKNRKPENKWDALGMMVLCFYSAENGGDRLSVYPWTQLCCTVCGYFCGHFMLALLVCAGTFIFMHCPCILQNFNPVLLICCHQHVESSFLFAHFVPSCLCEVVLCLQDIQI